AVEIAQSAIALQPTLGYRRRRKVLPVGILRALTADTVTRAVDELGPRIGRRQLESSRKPAIQARLQRMIRGVPLARANVGWPEVGIEAQDSGRQARIPVGPGRQSVTFRTDVGDVQN